MGWTVDTRLSKAPDSEHEWFRRHLPDHLLELLTEGEGRRFEAHARRCAPCARLLTSALGARADWWDGAGHPPVGALLDWDPEARADRTQEAVRAHLAACEDCRRDVSDLRGAALLSEIALAPVRERPAPARRSPAIRWGGLAAVAATVAAVAAILFVRPPEGERAPAPGRVAVTEAPATPAPAVQAPAPVAAPSPEPEPVTLVSAERGEASRPTVLRVAPGESRVRLTLPPLAVPDGVLLEIELRDAAGATVSRQWVPAERALRRGGVELPAESLAAGAHVLAIRWIDPLTGEDSREFALDVRSSR